MENMIKKSIDLTINYLFYSRIDTNKGAFYDEEISNLINENINSYDDAVRFYAIASSINEFNVKEKILEKFRSFLQKTEKLKPEEFIKLYFENDYYQFLNKRIDNNELRKHLTNAPFETNNIIKVFSISKELGFELLNNAKLNSVDLEAYFSKTNDKEDFRKLVNHYYALTPNTISSLINNSHKFPDINIDQLYSSASDNSISVLSNSKVNHELLLSKASESLFKKIVTDLDLQESINNIKSKRIEKMSNGLKVNILKLALVKPILSKEDIVYLLNNIKDRTINFTSLLQYDKELFNYILNEFTKKILPKQFETFLGLKVISPDNKKNILNYLISNNMFDNAGKYLKSQPIPAKLFMSIVDYKKSYIGNFKIKNEQISKDTALRILTTPIYYTQLDSPSLIYLLNTLDVENMLNIINDKRILSLLYNIDLADLSNLTFEYIISNDNVFEYYNKELLIKKIENYFGVSNNLDVLLNKNLSKLLFNSENLLSENDIKSLEYLIKYTTDINKEQNYLNINIIKSYVALYLTFGVENSINLINLNSVNPKIKEIAKAKDRILQAKINEFRMENADNINNAFNIIIYNLELMESVDDLNYVNNDFFDLLINSSDKGMQLLQKYIIINTSEKDKEELKSIKEEIRELLKLAINEIINKKYREYDKQLTYQMKAIFKLREPVADELSKKYSKELKMSNIMKEFNAIINSRNSQDVEKKKAITEALKQINLEDLCSYENFESNMLLKIVANSFNQTTSNQTAFDQTTFLQTLGYNKPNNFEQFIFNKKAREEIKQINYLFSKNEEFALIFQYLLGQNDSLSNIKDNNLIKLIKEKDNAIKRYRKILKFDGEKIVCTSSPLLNEEECQNYYDINLKANKINRQIFNIMQSEFSYLEEPKISSENLEYFLKQKIAINDENYEIIKMPLTTKEINLLFSNFDFNLTQDTNNSELIAKFIFDNIYSIRLLSNSESQYYVKNFGYILSHFDKLSYVCKILNIDINNITIEEIKALQDYLLLRLTPFGETVDKDVISKLINETDFIEIKDTSKRVERGIDLLEASQRKHTSTVPLLKSKNYEILDYHDSRSISSGLINSSCFRVGGTGNDFISYCVLSKDGSIIFIKNPKIDEVIGRISAVRRGNTYFMHQLQVDVKYSFDDEVHKMCEDAIEQLGKDLITKTSKTEEPIELVTITTYKFEGALKDKPKLSTEKCPYLTDPIDTTTDDYKNYLSYPYLDKKVIYNSFYHNYNACDTIIVSQSSENLKDYSAKPIYLRERKSVEIYDFENIKIDIKTEQKIRSILYLKYRSEYGKLDSERNSKMYDLSQLKKLTLGEDWCILEYNDDKIEIINLSYDQRSEEEIDKYVEHKIQGRAM